MPAVVAICQLAQRATTYALSAFSRGDAPTRPIVDTVYPIERTIAMNASISFLSRGSSCISRITMGGHGRLVVPRPAHDFVVGNRREAGRPAVPLSVFVDHSFEEARDFYAMGSSHKNRGLRATSPASVTAALSNTVASIAGAAQSCQAS